MPQKSFEQLILEIESKLSVQIGATGLSNIPENIADPLVQIVTHAVGGQAQLYKDLYDFMEGFNVSTASCETIDALASLIGESRNTNKKTSYSVVFFGTTDLVIPSNTALKDNNGIDWSTLDPITIRNGLGSGVAISPIGFYSLSPSELFLPSPISGVSIATNVSLIEAGFSLENCEQFRARLMNNNHSCAETEQGVLDRLGASSDFAKVIYDAPDCISDDSHVAFVVRGGSDNDIGNIIANYAPFNFATLAGNTSVAISGCETVKFIRPCPVGIKLQYWSETDVSDSQFIDAICSSEGDGLACIRDKIPCINHMRFSLIHSRPESLGCSYEDSGQDCSGTVSLISDDCPCSADSCDDGVFTDCANLESWEYPVFVSAEKEGVYC